MSPEQVRQQPVDRRGDVFSLGVVLYELLARRPAFAARTIGESIGRVIHDEPEALATLRPDLPQALVAVIERLLKKLTLWTEAR